MDNDGAIEPSGKSGVDDYGGLRIRWDCLGSAMMVLPVEECLGRIGGWLMIPWTGDWHLATLCHRNGVTWMRLV